MKKITISIIINSIALYLASEFIDGIHIEGLRNVIVAGIILGLVNALVKPILKILFIPFTFLTLGLFLIVINGIVLSIVAWATTLTVDSFGIAIIGGIVISFVNMFLNSIFKDDK